jgi:hypothetical protein
MPEAQVTSAVVEDMSVVEEANLVVAVGIPREVAGTPLAEEADTRVAVDTPAVAVTAIDKNQARGS